MKEALRDDWELLAPRGREIAEAIEALSEGFALFDGDDRMVFCNARFRALHRPVRDLLRPGLAWPVFLAEMGRRAGGRGYERLDAHLERGLEAPVAFETALPGDRWVRVGLHPTAAGGFVVTETDVTEAHAAAELRSEADDLLREVLDACAALVMMTRIGDGEILYRMPACKELFGPVKSARALYLDPSDRSDLLADLLPTGRLDDFETTLLRADGTPFPARVAARLVDYGGEQVIVASIQDLSQLHAQRDEIVRTNQRLFDAIGALDQGFALFDAGHRLVAANRLYHYVNAALADVAVPGAANADIVAAARARGAEPLAAGWPDATSGPATAQYDFTLPDGRAFSASRRDTSDGGFVLAWRDVTLQKAAERELARRREASWRNEKLTALGELLAGIAHELNNPLSVIVGQALMLREDTEDPDVLRRIGKISTSAERCARIVKTFLAMARQRPTRLEPCPIEAVIDTALDVAGHGLASAGAVLEKRYAADVPQVRADEDQILQVFINLLINAEQALAGQGAQGRVTISTGFDRARGLVVVAVADNGPGVPEHLRTRIFEPFFTTKEVGAGTGVGLALCHRIVASHGGTIEAGSRPGGGAVFTVALPAVSRPAAGARAPGADAAVSGIAALLVEDEEDVAVVIAEMLEVVGVAATVVRSAEEALILLEGGARFDVVLSDLKMPGRGGRALFEEVSRGWPGLADRFGFLTGDSLSRDADRIVAETGRPLLEKPVTPDDLRTLVRQLAVGREAAP